MKNEPWRKHANYVGHLNFKKFTADVARDMQRRRQFGIQKYGPEFVGDPLEHLYEELLDALFYVYMSKRKMDQYSIQEMMDCG